MSSALHTEQINNIGSINTIKDRASVEEKSVLDTKQHKTFKFVGLVFLALVFLGVGTGYLLAAKNLQSPRLGAKPAIVKTEKVAGSTDSKTFKDSAVGVIEKDGLGGEGTHKLIRDGGPSQTAFLVSSVVNLDEYIGKKVKVWGETFAAKKAAWLMDVGKVEIQ